MCNPLHSNPSSSSSDGAAEVFSVRTKGFESSSVNTEPSCVCKQHLIGVFSVPTKGSKEAEESSQKKVIVDTRHLNAQDLKTLKKQDPFLYYSLPSSVRRSNAGRNRDMDYMSSPLIGKSSTPTTKLTSTKVERRSCIHSSVTPT